MLVLTCLSFVVVCLAAFLWWVSLARRVTSPHRPLGTSPPTHPPSLHQANQALHPAGQASPSLHINNIQLGWKDSSVGMSSASHAEDLSSNPSGGLTQVTPMHE